MSFREWLNGLTSSGSKKEGGRSVIIPRFHLLASSKREVRFRVLGLPRGAKVRIEGDSADGKYDVVVAIPSSVGVSKKKVRG